MLFLVLFITIQFLYNSEIFPYCYKKITNINHDDNILRYISCLIFAFHEFKQSVEAKIFNAKFA